MSGNGPQTEIYKLATECRSKVVGLHVGSRKDTISTGKLPAASFEFSLRKTGGFYWTELFPFRNATNISMPWFHLAHVFAGGTKQSTTPSWLFWMFSFGTPPNVNWNAVWNNVLHLWNERVTNFIANAHANS